jgi:glutaminase
VVIETQPRGPDLLEPATTIGSPIQARLQEIFDRVRSTTDGELATYIPELAKADPGWFSACLVTVDGHVYEFGDVGQQFTIQSISKPFVYGLVLEDQGIEATLARVGVEPSGDAFNSIVVDESSQRPFNPMVNAGAIVTTGLVAGASSDERLARLIDSFELYLGRRPEVDEAVYRSELEAGDRNKAIAYLMRNLGVLDDPEAALDLYIRQCSLLVDTRDLARMAATLANGGVNPTTCERALAEPTVARVLSIMSICGMYDYAGEWVYRVGLPAKSGVSGGIVAVLPGQFGLGVYSPRLDPRGNSVRGLEVCEELSRTLGLHMFEPHVAAPSSVRQVYSGDAVASKRERPSSHRNILDEFGERIRVFELQGDIFFSSVESITRTVLERVGEATWVIFDGRRLGFTDGPGAGLLDALRRELETRGRHVVFAHLPVEAPVRVALVACGTSNDRFFADSDLALEWCEDALLAERGAPEPSLPKTLADHELFEGLNADEAAVLLATVEREEFPAGSAVFHQGAAADQMFFVVVGEVSVQLHGAGQHGPKRLTSLGPGATFGEIALLDGGVRSTEVRAERDTVCWSISRAAAEQLSTEHPHLAAILYRNLAATLSGRLRRANDEIRALAH